jgi:lysophospholipase L1-like esterase
MRRTASAPTTTPRRQRLADLAKRDRNLRIRRLGGLVARNRGWLAGDGVHVGATGYRARARAIAKQVEKC